MTQHSELFASLAAPFEPSEVKVRSAAGRQMHYITARTAMNRLDNVLGPENWWDSYTPFGDGKSFLCSLTIMLPDGTTRTKMDAGGAAGMADQGDDDKSAVSDAFKRACVKFGVARYLYRDGVPTFVKDRCQAPAPASAPASSPAPAQSNGDERTFWQYLCDEVARCNDSLGSKTASVMAISNDEALMQLVSRAVAANLLKDPIPTTPGEARDRMSLVYGGEPTFVRKALREILDGVRAEHRMGGRDEEAPAAPAPAPSANGRGNSPKTGRALFAWVKDQEQRTEVGLLKYINGWGKLQDFPPRIVDWDPDQVALAHAEAMRKLESLQASSHEAYEAALVN